MDRYVITIARQYGSGGRTIGEMLADRLGIHFYDKELMKLASEDSGINERLFNTADEKVKQNVFTKMFKTEKAYTGEVISPESGGFISDDNLFNYQAKVVKELAEKENCVIVGRCADYVLKDYDHVLSVFIHGPKDFCMQEAAKKINFISLLRFYVYR